MSTLVNDIIGKITTDLAAVLPTYSQLSHVYDVSKNKFKGSNNKYGVRPLSGSQNDLNPGAYTLDQDFEVIITDSYKSSKLLNDEDLRDVVIQLQDAAHDVYKQIQTTNSLASIKIILDMSLEEPEILEEDHVVVQRMTFTVKYNNSLK